MRRAAYLIFLSALITISCRVKKEITSDQIISPLTENQIKQIISAQQSFDFFSAVAKIKMKTPSESIKGKIWIRSQPDSVIWAVVKKASIEGGRAQMTKDSTSIIYRLEKKYQSFENSELSEVVGINPDLVTLSSMLIGHSIPIDTNKYWLAISDSLNWNVSTSYDNYMIDLKVNKFNGQLKEGKIIASNESVGHFVNTDFREVIKDVWLPYERTYIFNNKSTEELSVTLDFNEIELNIPKEIKFEIPSHYDRIK